MLLERCGDSSAEAQVTQSVARQMPRVTAAFIVTLKRIVQQVVLDHVCFVLIAFGQCVSEASRQHDLDEDGKEEGDECQVGGLVLGRASQTAAR